MLDFLFRAMQVSGFQEPGVTMEDMPMTLDGASEKVPLAMAMNPIINILSWALPIMGIANGWDIRTLEKVKEVWEKIFRFRRNGHIFLLGPYGGNVFHG